MIKQYLALKRSYPDAILLFRLGDFYEMFNEDAEVASKVLNITLTSRNGLPMCGVPYHSVEGYIKRLLDAGFKVAVCEQVEDPSKARGIVKREVVRVITPGTYIESEEGEKSPEYVASILREKRDFAVAFISLLDGNAVVFEGSKGEVEDLLQRMSPKTLIYPEGSAFEEIEGVFTEECDPYFFDFQCAKEVVEEHYKSTIDALGRYGKPLVVRALGALIRYLKEVLYVPLEHVKRVRFHVKEGFAYLDAATIRHLELVRNLREGTEEGTLFRVLNKTVTPMGYRRLREAILNPLYDTEAIRRRLDAVHYLLDVDLTSLLKGVGDVARIVTRVESGIAKPKELLSLLVLLKRVPELKDLVGEADSALLRELGGNLYPLDELVELIERGVEDDPDSPYLIKYGFDEALDRLKDVKHNSDAWIKQYEAKERARTGISSLKVKYNKVFGYYIEVTKAHLDKVPSDYQRKQTLVNAERFITDELKRVEEEILSAEERIQELERRIYGDILSRIAAKSGELRAIAEAVGELDFLNSLARVAAERNYVKPKVVETGEIVIKDGRHPVVEVMLKEDFVPNDTVLKPGEVHIITGPNMSGKSTYIRQVALIVLLAQMGSFVPAKNAVITPVDRIMTRIGTADNLAQGQSTFMVEMAETANILNNATPQSLVVLDEVGRGTSTYDGMSIAWATVEYIARKIGAKTLFATHYHELTSLSQEIPSVVNYRVEVKEWQDRIIFTHRLVPGGADKSYGIYVARLAGVPEEVVERAKEILAELESSAQTPLLLYEHPVIVKLRNLDLERVSPLEALMILEELKRLAEEGER